MTIAGAVQCRYPRSTTWKSTFFFYLEKKSPIFFLFLKCLDLSFSLSFYLSFFRFLFLEVCSSFISSYFVSFLLFFNYSLLYFLCFGVHLSMPFGSFTSSRRRPRPRQTPGPHRRYPWGQCLQWEDGMSSVICTRLLSFPTVLCVSCNRPP